MGIYKIKFYALVVGIILFGLVSAHRAKAEGAEGWSTKKTSSTVQCCNARTLNPNSKDRSDQFLDVPYYTSYENCAHYQIKLFGTIPPDVAKKTSKKIISTAKNMKTNKYAYLDPLGESCPPPANPNRKTKTQNAEPRSKNSVNNLNSKIIPTLTPGPERSVEGPGPQSVGNPDSTPQPQHP